jgi:soluble lytic murein transglycosylase-like protein
MRHLFPNYGKLWDEMLVGFDKPAGLGQTNSKATIQSQITAAANQYGVPPALALAVAQQESGFQQYNSSGGILQSTIIVKGQPQPGALGVMQLMPATAASLGVDPTDQQQNIDGGVKLLSQLLTQFNGNVPNALAAYNAGPGAVINAGGVPNIPETQNYVSSIMANYQGQGGSSTVTPGSSSDTSASDSSTDPSTGGGFSDTLASLQDTVSNLDFTDPTTIAVTAGLGFGLLYLIFG